MIPPNNVAAERHLLGVLLRDGLPLPPDLKASDFFDGTHEHIFAAMLMLAVDGITADELVVSQKLRELKSPVTEATVSLLVSDAGASTYRPEHVDLITNAALLRQAADIASRATDPEAIIEHYARLSEERKGRKVKAGPARMDFDALMSFKRKEDPTCVLGLNRWLCKGGSMLIVGQSGTGKSSLMMQAAVHWALGRDFFGIKPARPLRAIILQAENDAGDVSEALQDVVV